MSDKDTAIVKSDSQGLMQLIQAASLNPEVDAAKLAALLDVKLRWEADERRKAFYEAMGQFREKAPAVRRTRHVNYKSKDPSKPPTDYWHVELDHAVETLGPVLNSVGLSWRWSSSVLPDGRTAVTCIMSHRMGFEDPTPPTLAAAPDNSGGKNPIQGVGSAASYLERYTFLMACGVAQSKQDDDAGAEGMTQGAADDWMAKIEEASTPKETMQAWQEAIAVAKKAANGQPDYRAMTLLTEKRDARLKALKGAA